MKNPFVTIALLTSFTTISGAAPVAGDSADIGTANTTTSDYSSILGTNNQQAVEYGSLTAGSYNTISTPGTQSGSNNILLGYYNQLTKATFAGTWTPTVLIGDNNTATTPSAWVIGKGNTGQSGTVTLGTYAATATNAALIVGKGTSGTSRSNGLVVYKNGQVAIPSGPLVVGSDTVATYSYVTSTLNAATTNVLRSNTGFVSSPYTAISVGGGAVANPPGSMAFGNNAYAGLSVNTLAMGTNASAWGNGSIAIGYQAKGGETPMQLGPISENSIAIGTLANARYARSTAIGYDTGTTSYGSTVLGSCNLYTPGYTYQSGQTPPPAPSWVESDSIFEVGNGQDASHRSNAISTLKNGQTTLINKAWKTNTGSPLADPDGGTDSGGEALVVDGHTRLRGKVIIEQAQGDISMGNYQ